MNNLRKQVVQEFFETNEGLSDVDYGYNKETGKFDVPSVEMDGIYGTYWRRFESEKARDLFLVEYQKNMDVWVANRMKEIIEENQAKKKALNASKNTLGNLFPELTNLKKDMVNKVNARMRDMERSEYSTFNCG